MSTEQLIILLVVGAIAGWIAGQIMRGRGFGLIGDIIIGIIGAFIASYVFPFLHVHVPGGSLVSEIISATIGAMILLFLLRLIRR
jgi:uncharacterized membrane protein YeaQ/YmgE (transglycosylase-associated protein family)